MANIRAVILSCSALCLSACTMGQYEKLQAVGKEPPLQEVGVPPEKSAPISWPSAKMDELDNASSVNSLWQNGSKSFFGDLRARSVGDILKVTVSIQDKAELDNKSERKRNASDNMGVPSIFGLQGKLTKFLPGAQDPTNLLELRSDMNNSGEGSIDREEKITTQVAAVVTDVMPNGNLVIYGSQEVRVNFEVRQVTIQGVVRPTDVDADNQVDMSRIAEARINYGGRGQITDVQQPRVGSQIIDILSPW